MKYFVNVKNEIGSNEAQLFRKIVHSLPKLTLESVASDEFTFSFDDKCFSFMDMLRWMSRMVVRRIHNTIRITSKDKETDILIMYLDENRAGVVWQSGDMDGNGIFEFI